MIPYPKGKAFAWPNAIPSINNSEIILPKDVKENEKFIISVGRPSYQKNPLLMVETVKLIHERHPEVMFILVGVGYYSPMLDNMKSLIEKYKLQNVIKLIPWCSHEETLGYVSRAMFYMTTSLYEGLPIAVLEAMALGKPIVASDVIGNKDCVKDKYNGFLLPLEASTFAEYCNELLENEGLLQQMGQQSKLYFEQHFLIDKRIKDLENIYINVSSIK